MARERLQEAVDGLDHAIEAAGEEAAGLLERAVVLIGDPNPDAARHIAARADRASSRREDIEVAVERVMALQSPVARDLRFVLATALVAYHVERVAANAGRIARLTLEAPAPPEARPRLLEMGQEACRAVRAAVTSFAPGDVTGNIELEAAVLRLQEDERDVLRHLEGPLDEGGTTALLTSRYLTRAGEHASAIGARTAAVVYGRPQLEFES